MVVGLDDILKDRPVPIDGQATRVAKDGQKTKQRVSSDNHDSFRWNGVCYGVFVRQISLRKGDPSLEVSTCVRSGNCCVQRQGLLPEKTNVSGKELIRG